MKLLIALIALIFAAQVQAEGQTTRSQLIERGRYLVTISGCNDCHTPQFGIKNGQVPTRDWLIGEKVGWRGPWGTTYAANVRRLVHSMNEEQWIAYAHQLKTRPPMPAYILNAATSDDLKAMYQFLRSLGPSENIVPQGLPPGAKPKTPYIDMNLNVPVAQNEKKQ